ncbi:MAG: HAMP domain-containing histidine kinase [Anaerolineae bacterium]|nr:HAMP domain-containing histidine kinase [Anaerolineae bacterium]
MESLAVWLESHKSKLIASSLEKLSTKENLRREASGPVRWFFDSLIQAIVNGEADKLEALLRNWVTMCSIPINGQPVGLLPVLGVFKEAIWGEFQADPPQEQPLAMAAQLDGLISKAAEYLAKVEAAALYDAMSHHLTAKAEAMESQFEDVKNVFVSVTAHELKTPLTVIEGYANMLKFELSEATHPREALMVRGIETGVNRLRELIEDMIDVSLIDIDQLGLEFQPVWLQRTVSIAEEETRKLLKNRRLTLEIQHDTFPRIPIIGDPERLLKALMKVILNAVKYTPDGGKITVSARHLNNFIDIVVADTGIGIAPENLELIFEKFSTLGDPARHSSSKVNFKGGGPGLGLVIAKGIVEAHGGTIWAESSGTDEKTLPGSHFHLMIPVKDVKSGDGMSALVASAASMIKGDLTELRRAVAIAKQKDAAAVVESKGAVAKAVDPAQPISDSAESSERTVSEVLRVETSGETETNNS